MSGSKLPTTIATLPKVRFVCEQIGSIEAVLKTLLSPLFPKYPAIRRAFQARVTYGDPSSYDVALCITTNTGTEEPNIVPEVAEVFHSMFGDEEHLDVIFVAHDREQELEAACRPFWQRPLTG